MKKLLASRIFIAIITAIICISVTAYAGSQIFASNIGYTSTWTKENGDSINNVQDAIDELYNKASNGIGSQVTIMTQEQWDSLTLEQKIAQGLTIIDNPKKTGKYYDYTYLNDTVVSIGGAFTGSSGKRTISFDTIEDRRSTLFISSVLDNSNNSNITINNNNVSAIASSPSIVSSTMYSHALIIPNYKENSVSATYQSGDGGTYWSGCYAFDVADGTEIATSKAVFTTSKTITLSVEKSNNLILLINTGFGSEISNLNFTINDDTYTLKSHGYHFGCNTYAGYAIYTKDEQVDSYTITLPTNPGYGFSVTAIGIN